MRSRATLPRSQSNEGQNTIRTPIAVAIASLFCGAALGQSTRTPKGPVFEIADVHANPRSIDTAQRAPTFRNGRYEALRTTMLDLISTAYNIDAGKVVGGPNWLDFERFDIIAKAPVDTKPEALKLMLQALLADRFQLSAHMDNRPQPGYALTVGKGRLQLKQSDRAGAGGCRDSLQTQPVSVYETDCQNITMEQLAAKLTATRNLGGTYLQGPVTDSTGLTGTWDVVIKMTPANVRAASGEGDTVFDAVEKVGLKLERRDTPAPVLVVDRVSEQPTPNPPGTEQALVPPKDPQFEVASIKLSAPGSNPSGGLISPSGLVTLRNRTLRNLITVAWDVSNDAVIGLPKFADTDHFDLTAEAPASMARPVDAETIRPMLRALLADRFKLAVHSGEQPIDVYILGAPKSEVKMKKGNDAERGSCNSTPQALRLNSGLNVAFTCTNMTMRQLALRVRNMAPLYFNHPVVNETGLEGAWDFVLMWTGGPGVNLNQAGERTGPLAQLGSLTFFEAIEKQLGLKLTLQKRPMPVLIIDHLEPKPTEN